MLICRDNEILFSSHDTFELMRVLQEVTANSRFAAGEYLPLLIRYLRRKEMQVSDQYVNGTRGDKASAVNEKAQIKAMEKLEEVRLALARNLARALVAGFDQPF